MLDIKRLANICCILLLLVPLSGNPQPSHTHTAPPSPDHLHLPAELAELLRQEMAAILQGMQSLIPAIVSGDWKAVADIGDRIEHSYIMQQQLTAEQREALQHALPPAFRELDQSFHHYAGRLAHAAQRRDGEVVNFYFYKLTETCIACHTRFAAHRFPDLPNGRNHALPSH